jgi:hypothetical protein
MRTLLKMRYGDIGAEPYFKNKKGSQMEIGPPFKIQYPMKNSIK